MNNQLKFRNLESHAEIKKKKFTAIGTTKAPERRLCSKLRIKTLERRQTPLWYLYF